MGLLIFLFLVAYFAGFADAIAGGGGVLTVPALLLARLSPLSTLGTNKGQGVFGVAVSLWRYSRSPLLDRQRLAVSFAAGFVASVLGVLTAFVIPNDILRPLVLVLLCGVAIVMTLPRPVPKPPDSPNAGFRRRRSAELAIAVACGLGFYDGFFGPGTGMFLILTYAWLWHDPLDQASANAKVVNCASNLAAALTFGIMGQIVWRYALPMAAGQLLGGYLGAHTVIRQGRSAVRYVVIVMALAQVGWLAWRMLHSQG
jgi:uncharacterized protein